MLQDEVRLLIRRWLEAGLAPFPERVARHLGVVSVGMLSYRLWQEGTNFQRIRCDEVARVCAIWREQGFSRAEMAHKLACSTGHVRWYLRRAKRLGAA